MTKDIAASIRARLLNLAKERKEDFDFVLRNFVMQRVLYRLSISEHKEQFLLKGALLFWVWNEDFHRPTVDIDLLGYGANDVGMLTDLFRGVCTLESEDGLEFDAESIQGIEIKEDAKYQGVRITGFAYLTKAKICFQIDIGFGDAVTLEPEQVAVPSFLELPDPKIRVYPVYTVIAEKFQAMVELDLANSRIKDFYDIWIIASQMELEGNILQQAVTATFERRKTEFTDRSLNVFSDSFRSDPNKQMQWKAFLSKNRLVSDLSFNELMQKLQDFLLPISECCAQEQSLSGLWSASDWRWK